MTNDELIAFLHTIETDPSRGTEQFSPEQLAALEAAVAWINEFNFRRREQPPFDIPTLHKLSHFEAAKDCDALASGRPAARHD